MPMQLMDTFVCMNVRTFNEAISNFRVANYNFVFHSHKHSNVLGSQSFVYMYYVCICFVSCFFLSILSNNNKSVLFAILLFASCDHSIPYAIRINCHSSCSMYFLKECIIFKIELKINE